MIVRSACQPAGDSPSGGVMVQNRNGASAKTMLASFVVFSRRFGATSACASCPPS